MELDPQVVTVEYTEEVGDNQPSSTNPNDLVPVDDTGAEEIIEYMGEFDIENLEVFQDADIPKTNEDVEVVTQSNITDSEECFTYNPEDIVTDFGDDDVDLVEVNVHTTEFEPDSPPPVESRNDHRNIKIEEMDIACQSIIEEVVETSEIREACGRSSKKKGICLEDESIANSFEGMYTCDTVVAKMKNEENRLSECKPGPSRLLDYQVQCVNLHCQSGYGLDVAPVFVLTYFGQQRKKNIKQKVCRKCFKMAFRHQQDVMYRLKAHKSVLKADFPPLMNDVVVMDPMEEEYEEEQLNEEVMAQIRKYLPELMSESVQKYDLDFQLLEANRILERKFRRLEDKSRHIDDELNTLEKTVRESRFLIYKDFTPKIRSLPSLTIMEPNFHGGLGFRGLGIRTFSVGRTPAGGESSTNDTPPAEESGVPAKKVPPSGPLVYPMLQTGDPVYVMRANLFSSWIKGKIVDIINNTSDVPIYHVRIESSTHRAGGIKTATGKYIAYSRPSLVRYPVGTRIIALFKTLEAPSKSAFYAGLIAEPPKHMNKFRYLVFFDDGYAHYVPHDKIHLVCESSNSVFEDVHPESREFVKKYLERYPERPMVKLLPGQIVRTEWKGKWWLARVMELDCSLAKMRFDADGRTEWIYRGSTRLGPLYSELVIGAKRKNMASSKRQGMGSSSIKKKNMLCIEYNIDGDDTKGSGKQGKKKTTKIPNIEPFLYRLANGQMEFISQGYIRPVDLSGRLIGIPFTRHQCGPDCTEWTGYSETDCTGNEFYGCVMIRSAGSQFCVLFRQIIKHKGKRSVMYRAPCGRRLRTMVEVHRYLRITKTTMGVEFFDFDNSIHILDEFYLDGEMYQIYMRDVSYGLERSPVSCVNEIDHVWPTFLDYSTLRIPQEDVKICFDEEFLVNCDCDDDCQDKTKCECWKLTIEGTKSGGKKVADSSVGYKFKRLLEPVTTGIYECNHKCKCSANCLNRVAQLPFQINLQVFRTLKKGWGLRTLNDIPQGGFICIYAGRLHTEKGANVDGNTHGDEYMAELDYIEVVEKFKEGYESDVFEPGEAGKKTKVDEEGTLRKSNSDDQDRVPEVLGKPPKTQSVASTRARRRRFSAKHKWQSENAKEKEKKAVRPLTEEERRKRSVRVMYGDGPDEVYVMDAKSIGNIGRYLNHSCQPNVFVQNVFVDTHDLRFPWVAFFALTQIRAGTELTWDYNYEVGSVENKELQCYCNQPECRGRLL